MLADEFIPYRLSWANTPINVKPAGGGRAWVGDLIVVVVPGVGHLTDLVLPGEGIFESFFARGGDITLHACAVRFEKIRKSWRPMRTSEG